MAYGRRRDDNLVQQKEEKRKAAKSGGKVNLIIAIGASVALSVILSSIITLIIMPDSSKMLTQDKFNASVVRMDEIEEALKKQTALYVKLDTNYDALQTHLRHSSSKALKNILIDQEQNFQSFLTIFKAGMRDLAITVPDGMNWYNDYNQQMERALQHSIQREEILSTLQVGEVSDPVSTQTAQ